MMRLSRRKGISFGYGRVMGTFIDDESFGKGGVISADRFVL